MKLIDAEKAKDVIHEYFKSLMVNGASGTDVDRLAVGIGSCLKHDANLLKAIDELPSVQPERWIPVAEKSPLPQTPVWTTDIDGDVSVCKLSHSGNEWYGENDGRIYLRGSVVAWMPYNAPEPYQEGSFRKEVKEQE